MKAFCVIVICTTPLMGCGCAEQEDGTVQELERIKMSMKDAEAKSRIVTALSMRQNNAVDRKPVLIVAGVGGDKEEMFLRMAMYDENEDVAGLGVCEEWNTVDGRRDSLVEEYPVFAHSRDGVLSYSRMPVELRDSGQRKDEELWRIYAEERGSYESSLRDSASNGKIPAIYVSVPEPNDIDVFVYVYDRAGHKSDSVRLMNAIRQ